MRTRAPSRNQIVLLAGLAWAAAAPGPARAELPALIPRDALFGNPVKTFPTVSPDGHGLAYLAPDEKGVSQVWVCDLDQSHPRAVTRDPHRGVELYRWAGDSRHLLYEQDSDGDENFHVFSVDLDSGLVRDLTPFQGVRSQNLIADAMHPGEILVGLNLRQRDAFDMYRIDIGTGAVKLETENPGDVLSWTTDKDFVIRAATAFDPQTAETIVRVRDTAASPWRDLVRMPFEDGTMFGQVNGGSVIVGFAPSGRSLYVVSSLRTDMAGVVEYDAETGREIAVLANHAASDVAIDPMSDPDVLPLALRDPATGRVQAVGFEEAQFEWKFLDPAVAADFAKLSGGQRGFFLPLSRDRSDRLWVVVRIRDDAPDAFFIFDRTAGKARLLFEDQPSLSGYRLAATEAIRFKARDGLSILAYLTLPPGVPPKDLPLIVNPHGGPWWRDHDVLNADVQLFANRGYAVLQVEFRGSIGFGKKHLNAGTHQFGLAMEDDIMDGVAWAVQKGIADPKRLAIYGLSGGGYATLRAITEYPRSFPAPSISWVHRTSNCSFPRCRPGGEPSRPGGFAASATPSTTRL